MGWGEPMDADDKARILQIEANTARALALAEHQNKLLERLLEVVGEQPDYSGVSTNGNRDR